MLVPVVLAGAGALLPVAYLIVRAAEVDPAVLRQLVLRPRTWDLLRNTLTLTAGVLLLCTVLAVPLAYLVTRTDLRFKGLITWLAATPLAIPGYVMAYALLGLGGYGGLLDRFFDVLVARPRGYGGAVVALSLYTFPYLFLNVRSALQGLDPSLEESARSLGHGARSIAFRVILPQLRPALLAGWLIIALYVLGDFGVVALMRFETFSFAIYNQYLSAFNRSYAAWLALMLLVLTLAIVVAEGRLLGRKRYARVGSGAARPAPPQRLRHWAPLAWLYIVLVLGAALGLPIGTLAAWIGLAPPPPSAWSSMAESFVHSIRLAAPAALVATALALPIGVMSARLRSSMGRSVERLTYLGYAIPPVALALAFVMFSLRHAPLLYQTVPLLVAAYVVSYLALAVGPIRSALLQISPRIEEAARSLGRSRSAAFFRVTVPVIRRSLLASAALVLMVVMKELPMTYMLAPTGTNTLAMRVFSRTNEGLMAEAAPFAAAVVLFSSLFVGLLLAYEGRGDRG